MNAPVSASEATDSSQKQLRKLARKRLEKFVTLVPKVLVNDDPETIHDLRVWSRRLQQAVRVLMPNPKPAKSKKVIRTLRAVRLALGPCRDLDVNLSQLAEKRKHAGAGLIRQSWQALRDELEAKRADLFERARRDISDHDVFAFIERVRTLIDGPDGESDPLEKLDAAAARAMKAWNDAANLAYERRDEAHLHAFRIAGKRLRYCVELLADLGQRTVTPVVEDLKNLQTALGDWHDRCVLLHYVAEFIGRPDFLADHPDMGRALLAEMEKEKLRNDSLIEELFRDAAKVRAGWARWKPIPETESTS